MENLKRENGGQMMKIYVLLLKSKKIWKPMLNMMPNMMTGNMSKIKVKIKQKKY